MQKNKKSKTPVVFEDFIFNNPLPHDEQLERVALGAMMLESGIFTKVEKYLRSEKIFYSEQHQEIFKAIKSCFQKYNQADIVIVTQELRRMGKLDEVGGAYAVASLTTNVASTANIVTHMVILYEKFIAREVLRSATSIVKRAYEDSDDVFLTLDGALEILDDVRINIASLRESDFKDQVSDTMLAIQEAGNRKSLGYPTGLRNVDEITGGRVKGELTLIAARPSMGKTARMIQEAMNMALGQEVKVGIISMEMTHRAIIERMLSNISRINSQFIRSGKLTGAEWDNLISASGRLGDSPFFVDDISNRTVSDIRTVIRNWVKNQKVEIVFIDYIGLIKFQNQNGKPVDEIAKISRGLKTIAGECDIPIVALAQLNREVEKRGDKRPMMSDLRDSGSLEQDADVVSFLFRPEYYGIMQDDAGEPTNDLCEENIAKNRNGMIGRIWHKYTKEINEFTPHKDTPISEKVESVAFGGEHKLLKPEELHW
jgi:replicative DNA helicase